MLSRIGAIYASVMPKEKETEIFGKESAQNPNQRPSACSCIYFSVCCCVACVCFSMFRCRSYPSSIAIFSSGTSGAAGGTDWQNWPVFRYSTCLFVLVMRRICSLSTVRFALFVLVNSAFAVCQLFSFVPGTPGYAAS